MNIFLPFKRDKNPVLDEIEQHFDGQFIYDDYLNFDAHDIDIVNIHWPESIFNYAEPTQEDLTRLKAELEKWKSKAKIVFTRHNVLPHKNQSTRFVELYQLILDYSDGIIHLGEYSKQELVKSHPEYTTTPSKVIFHPAYTLFDNSISKQQARAQLNIGVDKKVILVFGSVRTEEELNLILTSFEQLNEAKKHLLISNLNIYKPLPKTFTERFKKYLNTTLEKQKLKLKSKVTINYGFIENKDVQVYMNAADVVLIPRINLLNSGNLFLGLSFKKTIVGPAIGNITEILESTNNPQFDPNNISTVTRALADGLNKAPEHGDKNYRFVMSSCQPKHIAQSYYNFFEELKS